MAGHEAGHPRHGRLGVRGAQAWGSVIHYWAAPDVDPLHLAYILGHEVGHVSGKQLRLRRNAWREELRADEYGAAAYLALKHVLSWAKSAGDA